MVYEGVSVRGGGGASGGGDVHFAGVHLKKSVLDVPKNYGGGGGLQPPPLSYATDTKLQSS